MSEPEERFPDTYSPIENFSDDEENDAAIPESLKVNDTNAITDGGASSSSRNVVSISADNPISPVTKKAKLSPSAYNTFQPVFFPSPPIRRSFSNSSTSATVNLNSEENSQVGMILQILSRYDFHSRIEIFKKSPGQKTREIQK